MAGPNPTDGRRAVPLDLPPSQVEILCGLLDDWREDAQRDLAHSKGPRPDPPGGRGI
jgi:hypothetical protein